MSASKTSESKDKSAQAAGAVERPADESAQKPPKYHWDDPNVPAGNAPPMPRWPLIVSAVVFGLWVLFLVAMAVVRVRTTSV